MRQSHPGPRALGLSPMKAAGHVSPNCTLGNCPRAWFTELPEKGQLWVHMEGIPGKSLPLLPPCWSTCAARNLGGVGAGSHPLTAPMCAESVPRKLPSSRLLREGRRQTKGLSAVQSPDPPANEMCERKGLGAGSPSTLHPPTPRRPHLFEPS